MAWKERAKLGRSEADAGRELGRYLRAAGVDHAIEALSGRFGLRRFLVRFSHDGRSVQVTSIESVPLQWGGGPPREDPTGQARAGLERALDQLHKNMGTGPSWTRGAFGVVRDGRGRGEVVPWFDEDSDSADLDQLPVPKGPGHPFETKEFLRLLAEWEPRMRALQQRTSAVSHDWTDWEIHDDTRLVLHAADVRRARCRVLATWEKRWARFQWQPPLLSTHFAEEVYKRNEFQADWPDVLEAALMAAARVEAQWLFVQETEDERFVLFAAVW